jgi:hypothetical protein
MKLPLAPLTVRGPLFVLAIPAGLLACPALDAGRDLGLSFGPVHVSAQGVPVGASGVSDARVSRGALLAEGARLPDITADWEARVARGDLAGVVSLIVQDGAILSADSAGWSEMAEGRRMGLETRVRIASMT